MNRLTVIVTFALAGLISASILLVIRASDDRPPELNAELPRDQQQEQQQQEQQSQPEPEPTPEDETDEAESGDDSEPPTTSEQDEEQQDTPADAEDDSPTPTQLDLAGVLIHALDRERPPIPITELSPAPTQIHVIQRGETLTAIARTYQIRLSELIEANDLDRTALLRVGQQLLIPIAEPVPEPAPEPEIDPVEVAPTLTDSGIIYGTIRDHQRNVVNTAAVALDILNHDPSLRLVVACIDRVPRAYLLGIPLPNDPVTVYWRINQGPLNQDRWATTQGILESPNPRLLFQQLQTARTLWLRAAGFDLSFPIEHLFHPQVAPNLLNCIR